MSRLMTRSRATNLARSGSRPEDHPTEGISGATPALREYEAVTPTRPHPRVKAPHQDEEAPRMASDYQNVKVVTSLGASAEGTGSWSSISPQKKSWLVAPTSSPGTDRILTFLQSARERGIPVRFGKWSSEEDRYLRKLVSLFSTGVLADVPSKSSMRAWLARMLNCCPMRISKKQMHGEKFRGKAKYQKNAARIENMTQEQYDTSSEEVSHLRAHFLKNWAKDEFTRRNVHGLANNFDDWYTKVLALVPTPAIAKNSRIVESRKRSQPDTPNTLRREIHDECKRRKQQASTIELAYNKKHPSMKTEEMREPDQEAQVVVSEGPLQPLCEAVQPAISYSLDAIVRDPVVLGDWISSPSRGFQYGNVSTTNYISEWRYTRHLRSWHDDAFEYTVCMNADQQHTHPSAGLLPSQKTSRLLIDFGPPSSWNAVGNASTPSSSPDCSQWSESDLMDDLAMLTEPGLISWEDISSSANVLNHSSTEW